MRLHDLKLQEIAIEDRLKNNKKLVQDIFTALRYDSTVGTEWRVKLGPRPTPEKSMDVWLQMLDKMNTGSNMGVISNTKSFYEWLTKMYATHAVHWEDIKSRGSNDLTGFYAMARRGLLEPNDRDLNKIPSFQAFEDLMGKYREQVRKYKEEDQLKTLRKDSKHVDIVNNSDYQVVIPLTYGASCIYARSVGPFANWCTGTLSTKSNWEHYTRSGPLIIFYDKHNPDNKFQMHASSSSFMDKRDSPINISQFAKLYPNAMNDIIHGMQQHKAEIEDGTNYNVDHDIELLKNNFASAFGSKPN